MALIGIIVGSSHPAHAEGPDVKGYSRNKIRVEQEAPAQPAPASPSSPGRSVRQSAPPTLVYTYWDLEWFGNDSYCLRRRSTTNAALARGAADARWSKAFAEANGAVKAECPATPRPERTPAEVADDRARSFWDVRVLPDPGLKVVPDYAITGKLVYLQITGAKDQRFEVDNPIGDDVTINAASRYLIDWGDGTPDTTTTSQGGPWPNGDVTHTYTDSAPTRTITVTQLWSARWAAGANRGDLRDLQTSSTLTLAVTQLQAVRNL